ncbi:MAG: ABC transporter permease [Planctomycetota bacterium]
MYYVWRHLLERRVRTSLSVLGVAASVAGIVALLSITYGMRSSMNVYMEASGASLVVFSREAADLSFSRIGPEDVRRVGALPGVEAVARSNFSALIGATLPGGRHREGTVFLFGRFPEERLMGKYRSALLAGRLPRAPSEILAGELTAEQLGLRVGDKLPLFQRPILGIAEFEVVGVFRTEISWENLGIVMHADVVQARLNQGDHFSVLFVYTAPGDAEPVRAAVNTALPHLIAMPAGEFVERFAEQIEILDDFVLVVTIIAIAVGTLGVLNTMMMSVSERVREIGTLRALGWSRRRVLRVVVTEGLLLSAAGGLIGLGLGYAGTEFLLEWFPRGILEAAYIVPTFLKGMVVALLVGLAGALYPALRAASLRPVEALRHE